MSLRLEDIELIKQIKYKYWRGIDTADIDLLRDLLTEDVKVDYVGGTYRWQIEGKEKMLAAIAAAASLVTALRASRVDPLIALRDE